MRFALLLLFTLGTIVSTAQAQTNVEKVFQGNGIKIGEVTQNSAIIWTRLTAAPDLNLPGIEWGKNKVPDGNTLIPEGKTLADMAGALPGIEGSVRLTYWNKDLAARKRQTDWVAVDPNHDFIHQFKLTGLDPGASYQVDVYSRSADENPGPTINGSFRTAPTAETSRKVSFTVVTGQDYPRRDDAVNGHKIYPLMHKLDPDFFVHTGDIEYYDKPGPVATNVALARFKWNRLFGLPFQRKFQNVTASYFIKDDHDTLKNDSWSGQTYGDLTWEQGLALFREQFPLDEKTYRTIR